MLDETPKATAVTHASVHACTGVSLPDPPGAAGMNVVIVQSTAMCTPTQGRKMGCDPPQMIGMVGIHMVVHRVQCDAAQTHIFTHYPTARDDAMFPRALMLQAPNGKPMKHAIGMMEIAPPCANHQHCTRTRKTVYRRVCARLCTPRRMIAKCLRVAVDGESSFRRVSLVKTMSSALSRTDER